MAGKIPRAGLGLGISYEDGAAAVPGPLVTADLQALYHLEDGTGATAADSSGNARHATLAGTPPWLYGSLRFNADGDQAGVATPPAALTSDVFTVCMVAKWTSADNAPGLGWDAGVNFPGVYAGVASTAGRPAIWMGATIYRIFEIATPVDLTDGEWHFLAFSAPGKATTDAASFVLRADGTDQTEFAISATGAETAKTEFILGEFAADALASGYQIAFLSHHDRVLSDAEKDSMQVYASLYTPSKDTIITQAGIPLKTHDGNFMLEQ